MFFNQCVGSCLEFSKCQPIFALSNAPENFVKPRIAPCATSVQRKAIQQLHFR